MLLRAGPGVGVRVRRCEAMVSLSRYGLCRGGLQGWDMYIVARLVDP